MTTFKLKQNIIDYIETIKTQEITLKESNKIIELLDNVSHPSEEERNSIELVLNSLNCNNEAKDNLEKYIKSSYYEIINGVKYDRSLLLKADNLVKGQGDGRISEEDMKNLLAEAADNNKITDIEKQTLFYISEQYNATMKAKDYLNTYFV